MSGKRIFLVTERFWDRRKAATNIPEDQDVLAWLVQNAAATVDPFRPDQTERLRVNSVKAGRCGDQWRLLDGRCGGCQHRSIVSRIDSDSRCQEDISLVIFDWNALEATRGEAIVLVSEVKLVWSVALPWGRQTADPGARDHACNQCFVIPWLDIEYSSSKSASRSPQHRRRRNADVLFSTFFLIG